jgi:prepilin-type N-terminal cleavage/methylation domain-containing protein
MKKGFTLIETLIYIALFTILIGAGFSTAFSLIQSGESLSSRTVTNSEIDFVLRKIDWALNGATNISISSNNLIITKGLSNSVEIGLNTESKIYVKENGGNPILLSTDNVKVEHLNFNVLSSVPKELITELNIDGISATTTKYLRQ